MTSIQPSRIASALGATFAILYIGCAIFTVLFPGFYAVIATSLYHNAMGTLAPSFTFVTFLYGLVAFTLTGYIAGYVFGIVWRLGAPKEVTG
jgi:hypothetical protein